MARETPKANAEIKKRSVIVAGHRTSVSLEALFWTALQTIAERRGVSVNDLVTEIDRGRGGNLSSAIRVHILDSLWNPPAADESP